MPDDNDDIWGLMDDIQAESFRHWELFLKQSASAAGQVREFGTDPTRWLTTRVGMPVYDHFRENAPRYLESMKAETRPGDGWRLWARNGAYNTSIDLVAAYGHHAMAPLQSFLYDLSRKMKPEFFDALDARQLLILATEYPRFQAYLAQRIDQVTTPYQYWRDFHGSFQRSIIRKKGAFANVREHLGRLEGGPIARTTQLGGIVIDMAEQTIAAKLSVAFAILFIYRYKPVRQRTKASFNYLFPKYTMWGMFGRSIPVRFIVSKPLAKMHGNPVLFFCVVVFMMAMSIARAIQDSITLERDYKHIHDRLKVYNRDVVNASLHLKYLETMKAMKKPPSL